MSASFSISRLGLGRQGLTRAGLVCVSSVALMLAACDEPEVILPGEREDIRASDATPGAAEVQNTSRSISLAAQKANADWPQSFGSPTYRTAHPALSTTPRRIWSASIGEGDSRRQRIIASPVVAGGLIYTLDAGAQVSAHATNGGAVWTTNLTPAGDKQGEATGGGLAYSKGVLYVSSGYGLLTAIDAKSGAVRWQQKLDSTGSGSPVVHDGLIYLVAGDDTGWAINTKDGRIAWQISGTPSVGNVLGAPAPALTSDLAIFAFGSGDIQATFRKGGISRWNASVSGQRVGSAAAQIGDVTGGPVVSGNRVFAGNFSGRTVAYDAGSGERLWTARNGALGPVWPAGDSIFMVGDRNQLIRAEAATGKTIWAVDLPGFVKETSKARGRVYANYGPVLAGGRVIVASNDGYLRFYDPQNGNLVSRVDVPDGATTAPVVAGKTLYVVSTKGELHAFR